MAMEASQAAGGLAIEDFQPEASMSRPVRFARMFVRHQPLGALGLLTILIVAVVAALGSLIAPYGKDDISTTPNPDYNPDSFEAKALNPTKVAVLQNPSWAHPLGTDSLGRDTLTRIIFGARRALTVGVTAASLAIFVGTAIAIVSAYYGGVVDLAIQRVVDAMIAIPGLLVLLLLVQIAQRSMMLTITALAILGVFSAVRVVRSAALATRSAVFVEAARAVGAHNVRIMLRHIAPNLIGTVLVIFSIAIGGNILAEAGLAFLNLSVPGPSWGAMVSEGRLYVDHRPMLSLAGGGAITITVLAFNLLGDALRDTLDPRQRGA